MQYSEHPLSRLMGTFSQLLPVVVMLAFFLLPLFLLVLPRERRWVKMLALGTGVGAIALVGLATLAMNDWASIPADWEYLLELLLMSPPVLVCLFIFSLPLYFVKLPTEHWWAKTFALLITVLSLVALGLTALVLDMGLPEPHSIIFCTVFIGLAIAANLPLALRFRSKTGYVLLAVFSLAVVFWNFGEFTREKTFKRFYAEIQLGMTKPEVQATLQKVFGSSHFPPPDYAEGTSPGAANMQYTLTDAPGKFGPWAALVIVNLTNDKVTEKRYESN